MPEYICIYLNVTRACGVQVAHVCCIPSLVNSVEADVCCQLLPPDMQFVHVVLVHSKVFVFNLCARL